MGKLTDRQIVNVRPSGEIQRLQDGKGLYLEVTAAGGKYWRYRYTLRGRENRMSLGAYPDLSLAQARQERDRLKSLCRRGLDPVEHRKLAVAEERERSQNTFQRLAWEYFEVKADTWTPKTRAALIRRAELHLFPWLGDKPIETITPPDLLQVLRRIESTGTTTVAHKCKRLASQVFRFGVASGKCERDPAQDLTGALKPQISKNYSAILDPESLGRFLRTVESRFRGSFAVLTALRLLPLLLLRPGELRRLEWAEVDMEEKLIRIPSEKMKLRRDHLIPMADQVVGILKDIQPLSGSGKYVLPGFRQLENPISQGSLIFAIRRLGWGAGEVTPHGFRATASTLLHEMGWPSAHIEMQLAHTDKNSVRAVYNRAEYLPERREMLQAWANHLDKLKAGNGVEKGV